jgi:UDPglucose 6-dehydrogenase
MTKTTGSAQSMQIAVIGSGYVGLVAGACFADLGHNVILIDNDEQKLAALRNGRIPIHEKFLPELLERHVGKRLEFSDDLEGAVRVSTAIFIAVGTPSTESGEADLSYVESVARGISGAIDGYKVIVEKSTVPVYTSDWIRKIISRNGAALDHFDVASNPEFLREGTAVTDFLYPDRIVLGADSERCAEVLRRIYAPLINGGYSSQLHAIPRPLQAQVPAPFIVTSARSAELIKHASNAFLAMKISFVNAVASICEEVGADVQQVCQGIGTDSRIGPRFLKPGIGYGGSCFPKDLLAFRSIARECGYDFGLLDEVIRINEEQRARFLRTVCSALWTLRGKRLGVLGLAFKGGTDDIRESPAVLVVKSLLQKGCDIAAYDPAAQDRSREVLGSGVRFVPSAYEAARDADALLILTEWDEFGTLDLVQLYRELKYPIIIDGRNLYDPQVMRAQGFTYYSVGRSAAIPDVIAPDVAIASTRVGQPRLGLQADPGW